MRYQEWSSVGEEMDWMISECSSWVFSIDRNPLTIYPRKLIKNVTKIINFCYLPTIYSSSSYYQTKKKRINP
ncbi:hypothetical protein L1987_02792 [Smallanthus sonchifolius]|uniref:Uncharacterized protein n=1 Tax=Smallanthus sonchifolius TaxID=185202 RepID=A0ACB9K8Z2_9ASTR|nr:hypothetical protein L1987_02792 [Smallanthus sonchifolius]